MVAWPTGRGLRERPRGPLVWLATPDSLSWAAVPRSTNTWELLSDLPLRIDSYALEPLQALVSSEFERKSTVIRLIGAGHEGLGEDVTYDAVDHEVLQAAGPNLQLQGEWTIGSFSNT